MAIPLYDPRHSSLVAFDPGKTDIITAAYGSGTERTQQRKLASKEFYHMAGHNAKNDRRKRMKRCTPLGRTVVAIESGMPTAKTANYQVFLNYCRYINHSG